MGKNILAGVAGIIVAVAIVWFVEMLGHTIYPPPPDLEYGDKDAMRAYVSTLPFGAFLSIGAAWFLGALGGTVVACRLGTAQATIYALLVGGVVLIAVAANLMMIPHPVGFSIPAIAGIVVAAWLGMKIGAGLRSGDA